MNIRIVSTCLSLSILIAPVYGAIKVKPKETILFLGDSVTWFGGYKGGFIPLILEGLKHSGVDARMINAGRPGDTSKQILDRVNQYVFKRKADWLILMCGLNDVGRMKQKDPEIYRKNINTILDQAKEKNLKVVVLTPTAWEADSERLKAFNEDLKGYCQVLGEICAKRNLPLVDLYTTMRKKLREDGESKTLKLTIDTIHMNGFGNQMIAEKVLEAFGLSQKEIETCHPRWNALPSMAPIVNRPHSPSYLISINEYKVLAKRAETQGLSVEALVKQVVANYISSPVK